MVSKLTDIMDMILSLRRNHLKNRKELAADILETLEEVIDIHNS